MIFIGIKGVWKIGKPNLRKYYASQRLSLSEKYTTLPHDCSDRSHHLKAQNPLQISQQICRLMTSHQWSRVFWRRPIVSWSHSIGQLRNVLSELSLKQPAWCRLRLTTFSKLMQISFSMFAVCHWWCAEWCESRFRRGCCLLPGCEDMNVVFETKWALMRIFDRSVFMGFVIKDGGGRGHSLKGDLTYKKQFMYNFMLGWVKTIVF